LTDPSLAVTAPSGVAERSTLVYPTVLSIALLSRQQGAQCRWPLVDYGANRHCALLYLFHKVPFYCACGQELERLKNDQIQALGFRVKQIRTVTIP
jgi:hypothetical protein